MEISDTFIYKNVERNYRKFDKKKNNFVIRFKSIRLIINIVARHESALNAKFHSMSH